jgi:uncharacterized protein
MKKLFLLIYGLILYIGLFGQENSMLWEIKHPESNQKSYVFGTIHMIAEDLFFISDSLQHYISQVDEVYFEVNISNDNLMLTMLGLMDKIMMPADSSLKDLLTDEDYQAVMKAFAKSGLPPLMAEKIKPLFLSMILETSSNNTSDGLMSNWKSYELEIGALAETNNIPINGLETIAFQISMFDHISLSDQASMLVDQLKSQGENESSTNDLYAIYLSQDLDKLGELINADLMASGYNDILLTNRNKAWITTINEQSQYKTCLYAVGAGHLPGEMGILNLLKEKGFIIRPIENKRP